MGHESDTLKPLAVLCVSCVFLVCFLCVSCVFYPLAHKFLNSFLLFFRARARGTPLKPNADAGFRGVKFGTELRLLPT
jgi:hypothetical protein